MAQSDSGDIITALEAPAFLSPFSNTNTTTTTTTRRTSSGHNDYNANNGTTATTTTISSRADNEPRPLVMGGRIREHRRSPKAYTSATTTTSSEVRRRVAGEDEKSGGSTLSGTGVGNSPSGTNRHSTTVNLAHIDGEDSRPLEDVKTEVIEKADTHEEHNGQVTDTHTETHIRTWTERMHGQRPDRHLFPYRSVKENAHAARTFLKRFFFLILIIPAWVIPNVLMAKARHDQELTKLHEGPGNGTTTEHAMLMWASAAAGEGGAAGKEEEPMLSVGVNVVVFLLNMLVMMHLGKAAGVALEELVPKFGASVVSIFDAMTSSSVELAVAAFALVEGHIEVVQAAVLGAILNNLLLMLGIAVTYGGYFYEHQHLSKETTQTSINILMLTSITYVIPVALDLTLTNIYISNEPLLTNETEIAIQAARIKAVVDPDILKMSHGMAIIFLIVYMACLLYQYHSRTFMVTPEAKHEGPHTVERRYTHFWFAGLAYICCMAAQIYSAKLLVHAVESLGHQIKNLSERDSFVGFILLPIVLVADLQEEVIAIRESKANHLDKAVSLMVGSCMQIALLVTPLLVIIGWITGVEMTFRFSILGTTILVGSVLIVNYLISDRETNWLEGVILLAIFLLCAIAFYYDKSPAEAGISLNVLAS
ncbi:hypothetical protein BGZ83_006510 [Gryganskiella cystojenkinii]|nr:hypothetical protein BGZ83_006510 [Gryganskiella cystojenkinii]